MTTFRSRNCLALAFFFFPVVGATVSALGGEADVVDAGIVRAADGTYRFDVTLAHADTGWEHYADAFEIVDAQGNVLAVRILVHPHVEEQPFTRSISGVTLDPDLREVTIKDVTAFTSWAELRWC